MARFVERKHRRLSGTVSTALQKAGRWIFFILLVLALFDTAHAQNNPYLAKSGQRPVTVRIATCALSGGFTHLYTALENNLFDKYGLRLEHVFIRGSARALTALVDDDIHFLYCAADATLPYLATGTDAKLVAAPLIRLPYVLVTRRDIRRVEDLKGKTLGVARPGDLSDRLSRALIRRFNVPDVTIRTVGASQSERYQALISNVVQGVVITPPLDVRAKADGFNITFRLMDLDTPFIYSSLHATSRLVRDKSPIVQRMVAGFAESVRYVDKNPVRTKTAIAKYMHIRDDDELQVVYQVYTQEIVDRRMTIPSAAIAESLEFLRSLGAQIKRRPEDIYDNSFVDHLEKSGFLNDLWNR